MLSSHASVLHHCSTCNKKHPSDSVALFNNEHLQKPLCMQLLPTSLGSRRVVPAPPQLKFGLFLFLTAETQPPSFPRSKHVLLLCASRDIYHDVGIQIQEGASCTMLRSHHYLISEQLFASNYRASPALAISNIPTL